jgi:hypothetical protein
MNTNSKTLMAVAGISAFASMPVQAYETGYPGAAVKPGVLIGASAGVPPPGIYMFNQVFTYQANLTGPGTTALGLGARNGVQAAVDVQGFLFVPGWTFLGATYDALIVQPVGMASIGDPLAKFPGFNDQSSGLKNTALIPVELSWKLGTSGFAVKTGLTVVTPDGTIQGRTGLNNAGAPFWTFEPEVIVSYLKDGWNLTAALYEEFNTANSIDNYTTGNIFHADFTATKTIEKWTIGPVAYYVAQVSNDSCPTGACTAINPTGTASNAQRYHVFALGGLVGYNFGSANLSVWATRELTAKASNPAVATGSDTSLVPQGTTVFATLSYRLWAPDEPVKPAMYHK